MTDIIKIGSEEVVLDRSNFHFDENTLNKYMMEEGGHYDYFGQKLADLEYYLELANSDYDTKYSELFTKIKSTNGGSDNFVKATCECDPGLVDLKKKIAHIKHSVTKLKLHLKAWDKNHENAQSFGHTLRREMDKLFFDIKSKDNIVDVENKVDQIVGSSDI